MFVRCGGGFNCPFQKSTKKKDREKRIIIRCMLEPSGQCNKQVEVENGK
jgi:hypothetical protein